MSRKAFIEANGATCRNWTWSWSFIDEKKKVIIFGAWEHLTEGNTSLILDENWARNYAGKKNRAYPQSLEHFRLVESGGYTLKTFKIIRADDEKAAKELGPAKIKSFVPKLTQKTLKKVGTSWYASDDVLSNLIPEEVSEPEKYFEGASNKVSVNAYERNAKARAACIRHYGAQCFVCKFDFYSVYGGIGSGYIHVHHLVPLSKIKKQYKLDPVKDLRPVCPNCHAIIHRTQPALTIEQLQEHLSHAANA